MERVGCRRRGWAKASTTHVKEEGDGVVGIFVVEILLGSLHRKEEVKNLAKGRQRHTKYDTSHARQTGFPARGRTHRPAPMDALPLQVMVNGPSQQHER